VLRFACKGLSKWNTFVFFLRFAQFLVINDYQGIAGQARNDKVMEGACHPLFGQGFALFGLSRQVGWHK
jgi:hypothetical protein